MASKNVVSDFNKNNDNVTCENSNDYQNENEDGQDIQTKNRKGT